MKYFFLFSVIVLFIINGCDTPKQDHFDRLIVIDAGHGGYDCGAQCGSKKEKELVLQIAKKLKVYLKGKGYRVYMTRGNDRFLTLGERTRIADKKGADIFISIHANAITDKRYFNDVEGVETYFLQKTRDAKSQRIAARENASVLKGQDALSQNVIIDSVLNGPKIIESNKLAIDVQKGMIKQLKSVYPNIKDGGARPAPFYVLVGASRPSILVEVGYITNPKERKRLFNASYQERIVKGISEGIERYFNNRKKELEI